jgi:hypothetical protein
MFGKGLDVEENSNLGLTRSVFVTSPGLRTQGAYGKFYFYFLNS